MTTLTRGGREAGISQGRSENPLAHKGRGDSSSRQFFGGMFEEPAIGVCQSFAQGDAGTPAERAQARDVEELARRAVGLRPVVAEAAGEAHDLGNDLGE